MEKEFIITKLVESTKVNGSMIKNMVLEQFSTQMVTDTKELGEMVKDGNKEFINTQTVMFMMDSGGTILRRVMENLRWPLEISMKAIGREERKMAKVTIL